MKILSFYDLSRYNTFGIQAEAELFIEIRKEDELIELLQSSLVKENRLLILGSGSNILFTKNFDGLVIHNCLSGIDILEETNDSVLVRAAGGIIWHDFVVFTLDNNWGGVENLSLIPGTVGAAPIQNIGAYGVELKEVMESLEAIEVATGQKRTFSTAACAFGYRDSIFKNTLKDQYVITAVNFRLTKNPVINTSYGAINDVLSAKGIISPTIQDVSNAVIEIRQSKLPDPKITGNAGSFFKNPAIDKIDFEGLKLEFPDLPGYENENTVKVPAAWLIDKAGWKGYIRGNIGVHDKQPLVLVNFGGGSGVEIKALADDIKESVAAKFGILLEPEPRII